MDSTLLGLYLKANLLLAASLPLWLLTKRLARRGALALDQRRQLQVARRLFAAMLLLLPLLSALTLIPGLPGRAGTWLAGEMTVGGDIERGLASTLKLGSTEIPLPLLLSGLLLAGFGASLLRLSKQYACLRQLVANGTEWKRIGPVRLLFSRRLATPFSTRALGRYQIVLPCSLLESPRNLRLAVKHELQHLRNGDLNWILLLEALKLTCFWNPAIHLWHHEFDSLQEFAVDEALLAQDRVDAREYGHCLLEVASAGCAPALPGASNMVPRFSLLTPPDSQLKRRLQMLVSHDRQSQSRLGPLACALVAGCGLLGASLLVYGAQEEQRREMPARPNSERPSYLPIETIAPVYPERALDQKLEGWIQISMTVNEAGNVVEPEIIDSCVARSSGGCISGEDVFNDSALAAIEQFRFEPRMENGSAMRTEGVQYVFRYSLQE